MLMWTLVIIMEPMWALLARANYGGFGRRIDVIESWHVKMNKIAEFHWT